MKQKSFAIPLIIIFLTGCLPQTGEMTPAESTPTPTKTSIPWPTTTPVRSACLNRATFGDPADSLYILPYPVGITYRIDQSYCTVRGSHSDQLAYDFAMDLGDDVTAARSGLVVEVVESYADNDTVSSHFNYVFIQHEDSTVAFYAHLMQDGVFVEVGDTVEAGQVIARVGHSAMPAYYRSVLHFGVYASWPPIEGRDIPVNFRNADGALDSRDGLAAGRSYEALPWIP